MNNALTSSHKLFSLQFSANHVAVLAKKLAKLSPLIENNLDALPNSEDRDRVMEAYENAVASLNELRSVLDPK